MTAVSNDSSAFSLLVWLFSAIAAAVFLVTGLINRIKYRKAGIPDHKIVWKIAIKTYWKDISIVVAVLTIIVIVGVTSEIKVGKQYEQAISCYDDGKYEEAYGIFSDIPFYKDSEDYIGSDKLAEYTTTIETTEKSESVAGQNQ